jgi:hypothetical protein
MSKMTLSLRPHVERLQPEKGAEKEKHTDGSLLTGNGTNGDSSLDQPIYYNNNTQLPSQLTRST